MGMTPPKWLMPGDVVRIETTGLGSMNTKYSYLSSSYEVGTTVKCVDVIFN